MGCTQPHTSPFIQVGLSNRDSTRFSKKMNNMCVFWHCAAQECPGTASSFHLIFGGYILLSVSSVNMTISVIDVAYIFDQHRNTMKWPSDFAIFTFAVHISGDT